MESNPVPEKKNLIHTILDELNKDNIPLKLMQPYLDYIKNVFKPYYTFHIFLQIIIIALLMFIVYKVIKL